MSWFSWLRLRPKPKKTTSEPVRIGLVFVDVPNVVNAWRNENVGFMYAFTWIEVLDVVIRKLLTGYNLASAYAFSSMEVYSEKGEQSLQDRRSEWLKRGYRFHNDGMKDIDSMMLSHIWLSVVRIMEEHESVELRLVIVSGDGIFAKVIRQIQQVYAERLTLDPYIYAWGPSVSRQLKRFVPPRNIRHLEDIPGVAIPKTNAAGS